MAIWEATNQIQLSRVNLFKKPTALDVSKDGKVAFVGFESGVVRIYDISNRAMPRLLKMYNFFEKGQINVVNCSMDGKYVLISSPAYDYMYLLS